MQGEVALLQWRGLYYLCAVSISDQAVVRIMRKSRVPFPGEIGSDLPHYRVDDKVDLGLPGTYVVTFDVTGKIQEALKQEE
jgi:hypothetical protein